MLHKRINFILSAAVSKGLCVFHHPDQLLSLYVHKHSITMSSIVVVHSAATWKHCGQSHTWLLLPLVSKGLPYWGKGWCHVSGSICDMGITVHLSSLMFCWCHEILVMEMWQLDHYPPHLPGSSCPLPVSISKSQCLISLSFLTFILSRALGLDVVPLKNNFMSTIKSCLTVFLAAHMYSIYIWQVYVWHQVNSGVVFYYRGLGLCILTSIAVDRCETSSTVRDLLFCTCLPWGSSSWEHVHSIPFLTGVD